MSGTFKDSIPEDNDKFPSLLEHIIYDTKPVHILISITKILTWKKQ